MSPDPRPGRGPRGPRRGPLEIAPGRPLPVGELRFATSRSGGPGGQHVNKVETRVEVRWDLTRSPALSAAERARVIARLGRRVHPDGTLRAVSQRHRTQLANRQAACERLAAWVAEALRPPRPRRPTRPPAAAGERRLAAKRRRSELKRARRGAPDE
ncbi:MAG TPA: alternative ribosome rescue aminoacyl-tRNA hydrolase ArfB [Candidatus Saccharimonadales bacterium]|nr:alternative ribosome rescue aminoacyl-tRNA hydrolase ArfB [Candidatus Saccharimonadales bacterium]